MDNSKQLQDKINKVNTDNELSMKENHELKESNKQLVDNNKQLQDEINKVNTENELSKKENQELKESNK